MTHPLTDTIGSNVTRSLNGHGRADYRRGAPYRPEAAQAWRDGWVKEAHTAAVACLNVEIAAAMSLLDALAIAEAAERLLRHATVSRPTRSQAALISESRPIIEQGLERLRAAVEAAGPAAESGLTAR